MSALVSVVSSASPTVPAAKPPPSSKRGPISARGNLSKALALALDRQKSSFPITFTPVEPEAPAVPQPAEKTPGKVDNVETAYREPVAEKKEDDSDTFQLVKPKSKSKGRRVRRRPSTTLEEGGR